MKIMKFGGTSLRNADRIKRVSEIISEIDWINTPTIVVVSATGKTTDLLVEMSQLASKGDAGYNDLLKQYGAQHKTLVNDLFPSNHSNLLHEIDELINELEKLVYGVYLLLEASPRTMAYLLSFGERISAIILSAYLKEIGVPSAFVDAREIIKTNRNFLDAEIHKDLTYNNIQSKFDGLKQLVPVVTGFIATSRGGLTTTLGRGGSDYTAAIIAAALDAEVIEIWTDVDGVLTADPNKVRESFTIPQMTFEEAVEMSHFGARVIYPPTIQPALEKNIPIYIKNSFNPGGPHTLISKEAEGYQKAVKGISSISPVALLTLQGNALFGSPGMAARLFQSLAISRINIILITQGSSENNISFAISPKRVVKAKKVVEKEFEFELSRGTVEPLTIESDLAIVAIIGDNMRSTPGIAGKMFATLGKNGVNAIAIAQGSSERNISVVIDEKNEAKALNSLHESFFLSEHKVVNLFMIGVGLIGGTLLEQILKQSDYLFNKVSLELRVIGIANTKTMHFNEQGIDLSDWRTALSKANRKSDVRGFVDQMIDFNLPNSIFIDNTADSGIPDHYNRILNASISIHTPNKYATSSAYQSYSQLHQTAKNRNVGLGYETNVGAGLPVIGTLRNLIHSGDQILKIEAVLSGSLSYIFNSFSPEKAFSDIVKLAQKKGFTEPDPREDLSGADVKRKILILSREAGLTLEPSDVQVEPILPQELLDAESVDQFFNILPDYDQHFNKLVEQAQQNGNKIRLLARLEHGKASIALSEVDSESPFYHLSGSDNMIIFTTKRYFERPLVVQGPGAGADVTAAGLFAEIIQTSNWV